MSLSTWAANGTCLAFTLIYVVGFYVFNTPGSRNEPPVMRARMKAVTLASIVCYFVVVLVTQETKLSSATLLGLQLWPSLSWLSPVLLTMMLFLGPLAVMWFDGELPFQKNFSMHDLTSLMALRNFVVVHVI
jgi:prenyl protein peptidase